MLSGTKALIDVTVPVTVSGNAVSVIGDSSSDGAAAIAALLLMMGGALTARRRTA